MAVATVVFAPSGEAQPATVSPRWNVTFQAHDGRPGISAVTSFEDGALLAFVAAPGADVSGFRLQHGAVPKAARLSGYDPVSGLCFIRPEEGGAIRPLAWLETFPARPGGVLRGEGPSGEIQASFRGWVKQIGDKVLPFALLRFDFTPSPALPGTPLIDADGRVVALVFQSEGGGGSGYALPAEAVHRVRRDVAAGGRLTRGWLGLTLRAESSVPRIVRVLPESPAAGSAIQADDILVGIGDRPVVDYADAVNAFFYLVPGKPVKVKVLRGEEPLDITLTPTHEKPQ